MTYIAFPEGANEAADNGPGPTLPPGSYRVVVSKVEDKRNNEGAEQVFIHLSALVPDGDGTKTQRLVMDTLTFSEKGKGLAIKKLRGLSIDTQRAGFETSELEGKTARTYVVSAPWVDRNGGQRQGLKVDINQGTFAGYDQEEQPAF